MKVKNIKVDYKPLSFSTSINEDGATSKSQQYDADFGEYSPDYSLVPLVLHPHISVHDPNGIIPDGEVNASLTSKQWTEYIDGIPTPISSNSSYDITSSGDNAGLIKVKKNVVPGHPITLVFTANYFDIRLNQNNSIRISYIIMSNNVTSSPVLEISSPSTLVFNPWTDSRYETINARELFSGRELTNNAQKKVHWCVVDNTPTGFHEYSDNSIDPEFVSGDSNNLVIDKFLIGESVTILCKVELCNYGGTLKGTINDCTLEKSTVIRRKLESFDFNYSGVPSSIPPDSQDIYPSAIVTIGKNILTDAQVLQELMLKWYTATPAITPIFNLRGKGINPTIPVTDMNQDRGMMVGLDVNDLGPYSLLTDTDGNAIQDSDGSILIFK